MKKIETVISKYKDLIKLFELGKKIYFVPKEFGKFQIYEGFIVENLIEYDSFEADTDGFRIRVEIELEENNKPTFSIIVKRKIQFKDEIKFICSNDIQIDYEYFIFESHAKDFLLKKNEAYIKKISLEKETFKNYS